MTKFYCELRSSQNKCRVTGAKTFRRALSTILANPVLPAEEILVEVIRGNEPHADVSFFGEDMNEMSTFLPERKWKPGPELYANKVYRIIQIDQDLLHRLAEDIAHFKKDSAS